MSTSSESRDERRARRSERGRAPWLVGLGVSAAIHLVALLLYSGISFIPAITVTPPTGRESPLDAIRLIDIAAVEQDEEESEEEDAESEEEPAEPDPVPEPAADRPAAADEPAGEPELVGPEEEPDYLAAAERLRVRAFDPRLFVSNRDGRYLGVEELLLLDLDIALAAVRDSLDAAQERAEDALDWTWTDADGRRWGVSPGKIHLGDVTLPLPTSWDTGTSPWNREAEMRRARENAEIENQAVRGLILQTWEERIRAMRERADRERARQMGTPPDTTQFDAPSGPIDAPRG